MRPPMKKPASAAMAITRWRKMASGRSGSAARICTRTNSARIASATRTSPPTAGDGHGHRDDRARPEPLERAERHQRNHALREAAQRRADDEDRAAREENRLAAVQVGQLAVDRDGGGGGEQVDGEDPAIQGEPA